MTADPTELGRLGAQEAQPSSATVVAGRHAKESPGPQPLTAEELAAIRADLEQASPLDRECEELRAIEGLLATVEALQAQVAELEAALEGIRCNSEPNTMGGMCDLPEETEPHTREQHLEAQIRMLNQAARAALQGQGQAQRGEG